MQIDEEDMLMSYLVKDNQCGSCQYWNGERTLTMNNRQARAEEVFGICEAPAYCPYRNLRQMGSNNRNCKWYSKWDQLK